VQPNLERFFGWHDRGPRPLAAIHARDLDRLEYSRHAAEMLGQQGREGDRGAEGRGQQAGRIADFRLQIADFPPHDVSAIYLIPICNLPSAISKSRRIVRCPRQPRSASPRRSTFRRSTTRSIKRGREIGQRYDFKGDGEITLNTTDKTLTVADVR
jgi:hypothetical protein